MSRDSSDLDLVRSFYGANVQSVGPSFPALGWYTPETQRARFEVFTLLGDFSASQVLDAGCGLGDLFRFLKEKHYDGLSYTGLDVMADFIAQARHRYQQHGEARFFQLDWSEWIEPCDWLLCSGALNLKQPDPYAYAERQLRYFIALARRGVAVNFLSAQTPQSIDEGLFYYYDSVRILALAKTLTPFVALYQDYLPNDFTLFLYPNK